MSQITYGHWIPVGEELVNKYQKKYLTPEKVTEEVNPLATLVALPGIPKFFGTKVCNIFIVGLPFGWKKTGTTHVVDWPPLGYNDAKNRHIETFKYFSKYETHVYMDYYIVKLIEAADPETRFRELMDGTKVKMQEMCTDLANYGFKLEPDIVGAVTANHFYDIYDAFYNG